MKVFITILLFTLLTATAGYLFFLRQQKQFTGNLGTRETSPTKGSPGDKIVLTGFFTPVGKLAGSVSPFTNKIETYLRFAGLPHRTENGGFAGSPKGRVRFLFLLLHLLHLDSRKPSYGNLVSRHCKYQPAGHGMQLPWMQHGQDIVADSRFIVKYLQNTYGSQLKIQEPQDAASQAISTLIQRMCEEHMYFTSQYHRMVNRKVMTPLQYLIPCCLRYCATGMIAPVLKAAMSCHWSCKAMQGTICLSSQLHEQPGSQPAVIAMQASGWFQNALFKDAPGWQSVLIMYAFRAGRSKQLRYQVCFMADLPPCKARTAVSDAPCS